ncbi:amino acid ABC transporter permease [Cognatishimia maritima]|uniref:General L-amino acid transport system permease protein n=1 Tax=Cognatishimia maritima TaxID=870908 RepID=A0A1M5LC77_9RHOB|nr:amino acid ABC transporter permease [Cognatishimia maritima]SHG62545.1 general L-amino acid transport system permease protein [Cognatishimia maritima]
MPRISHTRPGEGRTLPRPDSDHGWLRTVRDGFFSGWISGAITVVFVAGLATILPSVWRWAVADAVWYTTDPSACRAASGACWAVVAEKYRVILFGTYPYDQHWRGALVVLFVTGLAVLSSVPRLWSARLFVVWAVAAVTVAVLMFGGIFGLPYVGTNQWGGLPLTMIVFITSVVFGLPLAVVLALGRRSHLPVIRAVCIGVIEIVRGLPLVSVLFMMIILLPLFLPSDLTVDKLLRALIGMVVFFGAYAAEVVRGGLQAIPAGQYDAAKALGLGYWPSMFKIILPQALRIVIPALMNDIIRAFKNTTFVSVIGIFDMLGATKASLRDVDWVRYSTEAYIFVALVFFLYCFAMSRYSQFIETRLGREDTR